MTPSLSQWDGSLGSHNITRNLYHAHEKVQYWRQRLQKKKKRAGHPSNLVASAGVFFLGARLLTCSRVQWDQTPGLPAGRTGWIGVLATCNWIVKVGLD